MASVLAAEPVKTPAPSFCGRPRGEPEALEFNRDILHITWQAIRAAEQLTLLTKFMPNNLPHPVSTSHVRAPYSPCSAERR
jgi:hypothetical protein